MKLRILAADDNALFLQKIISILKVDFDVVASATDGQAAVECIRDSRPDIAVLDLEMPLLNGIDVARELISQGLNSKVIICSVETDAEIVNAALELGVMGYVFKSRIQTDLVLAVRRVAVGQPFVSCNGNSRFTTI
jgi:two-component system, NarL family, response regulator DegU